jgi:hypothetical protein
MESGGSFRGGSRRSRPAASKESTARGTVMDVTNMDFTLAGSLEELKA